MNWFRLLYPHPSFEVPPGPNWLRFLHGKALHLAYYLTHTVALIFLSLIYLIVIIPLKVGAALRGQDLLKEKLDPQAESYFQESESLKNLDFKRMY